MITRKDEEEYESEEEIEDEAYYLNSTDSEIEIASDVDWLYLEEFKEDYYEDIYLQDNKTEEQNKEIKEHLKIGKEITSQQEIIIWNLIEKYKNILALSQTRIERTNIVKHKINTENYEPIAQLPYTVKDLKKKKFIKEEIKQMEKEGIISKLLSFCASPVVIVAKKDGSLRYCVDYKKLNKITKTDTHPLLRIDDLLEQFREAK